MEPVPTSFERMAERYSQYLQERNFSEGTIRNRRRNLGRFLAWCRDRGIERMEDVTRPVVESYQRHLFRYRKRNGKPLAFQSQLGLLVPVKSFFRWAVRSHMMLVNPAGEIEFPQMERRLPRNYLSAVEAESVIRLADVGTPLGIRDRAILETLYSTGIRRMELCGLSVQDVDFIRGTVFVRLGKGKKDRVVPIGRRALQWMETYLHDVRPGMIREGDDGALFLTVEGRRFHPDSLTTLMGAYVKRAALGKPGACHIFRHTCATLMLENGADVRFVQAQLGHEDLNSTMIYTNVAIAKLKEIHHRTHPAEKEEEADYPLDNAGACRLDA
ncbi:MAG: site-specific tyrosine recombinase XerC [Planctomycetota bacterium]